MRDDKYPNPPYLTPEDVASLIRNDPAAHALFRAVTDCMTQLQLTPGEIRAIAVYAATEWERYNTKPFHFGGMIRQENKP